MRTSGRRLLNLAAAVTAVQRGSRRAGQIRTGTPSLTRCVCLAAAVLTLGGAALAAPIADTPDDPARLRKPFAIEATTCREPGANWSIPEHKVIFCYEFAEEFVQQYRLHGEDPLATLSPPSGNRSGQPLGFR